MLFARPIARHALLALAVLLNLVVVVAILAPSTPTLEVSFLDVGQGDAIFIEGPTGLQVLIDGGKDRSVLRELGKRMGPLDRTLDLVLETHPDSDHIGGLPGVFASYRVSNVMSPGVPNETTPAAALLAAIEKEGIEPIVAERGMRIALGGGAYTDVLFPDRDVSGLETNTGSVVLRVVYGTTSFFLSGDAPESIENWLVRLDGDALSSDVVKAGHHGSRTSTGAVLLGATKPEVVVISAGKDNSYGHPHAEVLTRIAESGAAALSTIKAGTITFHSDGTTIRQR